MATTPAFAAFAAVLADFDTAAVAGFAAGNLDAADALFDKALDMADALTTCADLDAADRALDAALRRARRL